MKTTSGLLCAIYGRASSNLQRETSIDDQITRCKSIAAQHGYIVPEHLVFSDYAISGKGSETHRREAYADLLSALGAGKFQALVVDEQSRLFRDEDESLRVKKLIKSTGVRVISADGLDTANPTWELVWGFKAVLGQNELTQLAFRVKRGMHGALDRGFTAWAPPFGYDRKPEYSSAGDHIGTRWAINEDQAAIVRRIFTERYAGKAFGAIAAGLNASGLKTSRGQPWRVSSIVNILTNRTYAGVLVVGGSKTTKDRVRTGKRAPVDNKEFKAEYYRPELVLVDANVWQAVQPGSNKVSQSGRGGGKHWAAGLLRCSCGTVMTVKKTQNAYRNLYCSTCSQGKRVGVSDKDVAYVNEVVLREVLQVALIKTLTDEHVEAFRQRLADRLKGGFEAEVAEAKVQAENAKKTVERLARALAIIDDPEAEAPIQAEIAKAGEIRRMALAKIAQHEIGMKNVSESAIRAQLEVNMLSLIPRLFEAAEGSALRSALTKVFPSIVFEGRTPGDKYESYYSVSVAPGLAASLLSGTPVLDEAETTQRYRVRQHRLTNTPPQVHLVASDGTVVDESERVKRCGRCEEVKPVSEFNMLNTAKGMYSGYCTLCTRAYHKEKAFHRNRKQAPESEVAAL